MSDDDGADPPASTYWWAGISNWFKEWPIVRQIGLQSMLERDLRRLRNAHEKTELEIEEVKRIFVDQWKNIAAANPNNLQEELASKEWRKDTDIKGLQTKLDETEKSIRQDVTRSLRDEADRYLIPFPEPSEDDMWVPNKGLSDRGISVVRSRIRDEQKERSLIWQSRIALSVGLLGTLIGLFSSFGVLFAKPNQSLDLGPGATIICRHELPASHASSPPARRSPTPHHVRPAASP